jgi:hypothetical protein
MVAYPRCLLMTLLAASKARISTKALTIAQNHILPLPEPSHDAKCGLARIFHLFEQKSSEAF